MIALVFLWQEGLPSQVLTREIFGNIGFTSKVIFYCLTAVSLGLCIHGLRQRARLWSLGSGSLKPKDLSVALVRFGKRVLLQRAVRGRGPASLAHMAMFTGIVLLALGSLLVAVEHYTHDALDLPPGQPLFHKGLYYVLFEVVTDTAGLLLLAGTGWFALRRFRADTSIGRAPMDGIILGALLLMGLSGYALEGLRILREETPSSGVSYVGYVFSRLLSGMDSSSVGNWHLALWWVHSFGALAGIAALPHTRLLHLVAGSLRVALQEKQLGFLEPVRMEEVEASGRFGAGRLQDLASLQLLELDACVSCGRCEDACPAFAASKPLSPRDVVQAGRGQLNRLGPLILAGDAPDDFNLHGDLIQPATLWACTTCNACSEVCPLGVSPMHLIIDMRRHLIGEGELRGAPAQALQRTQRQGNPWGLPSQDRLLWSDGLGVQTPEENPDFEVLYWVGCAAAYDPRAQAIARATVQLMQHAGVNFAVLGSEERCTGETARRMGDEFVFQELAQHNVGVLDQHRVRKIVTHCPHCLNSLLQDYPDQGGLYEVLHHTAFLEQLVQAGVLQLDKRDPEIAPLGKLTYHDPCYLARVQGEVSAPRALLKKALGETNASEFVEVKNNGCQTKCCGAGGGRMWFDDQPEQRIGADRMGELLATDADTIAVGCPFCLRMVTDGTAAGERSVQVLDVAEILLGSIPSAQAQDKNTT